VGRVEGEEGGMRELNGTSASISFSQQTKSYDMQIKRAGRGEGAYYVVNRI